MNEWAEEESGIRRISSNGNQITCSFTCLVEVVMKRFLLLLVGAFGLFTARSQSLNFTKNGPPVLGPTSGAWDSGWTEFVSVIREDTQYVMWYSGATNSNGVNLGAGRATSSDGIQWQKDVHNPVIVHGPSGAWDAGSAWIPKVMRQGSGYTMWYTGTADPNAPWQIGRAVSNGGVTWTRDTSGAELTLGSSGQWDAALVHTSSVLYDGSTYRMWYTGMNLGYVSGGTSAIGVATSTDGIHWVKATFVNPVLTAGPPGAWDAHGVGECCVVHNPLDSLYHMFYDGNEIDFFTSGTSGIGHATSRDGTHWTKDAANPVLLNGAPGAWDNHVCAPFVILDDHKYKMWYSAEEHVGYAWAPDPATAVTEHGMNGIPNSFSLDQNYPNPFNPTTTIRYGLPHAADVTLRVYNTLGQEVAQLVNEQQQAGYHENAFRGDGLASGVYFYRIQAGSFVQSRKLVLLR